MDYSAYDTADFVCDDSFVAWVKDGSNGAHWEQVIKQYPDQQENILQPGLSFSLLPSYRRFQLKEQEQQQLCRNVRETMDTEEALTLKRPRITHWYWAAAVFLILSQLLPAGSCVHSKRSRIRSFGAG